MPPGASQYEVGNVGRDAIVQQGENLSIGLDEEKLVNALAAKGLLQTAETVGLQRRVIINLARRLKGDVIDFDQAVVELESAVEVALEVIARGERSTNADEFVAKVLSEIAEKTKREDFDGGARTVDDALAELDRREVKQRDAARASCLPRSRGETRHSSPGCGCCRGADRSACHRAAASRAASMAARVSKTLQHILRGR